MLAARFLDYGSQWQRAFRAFSVDLLRERFVEKEIC